MNSELVDIKKLPPLEAIPLLERYISAHPEDDEGFLVRGMKQWALGKRKEAISDYLSALKLNSESPAKILLQQANNIMSYYNKDLLNP